MIDQIPWVVFFLAALILVAGLVLLISFKMPASFRERQAKREQLKKLLLEKELLKPLRPESKPLAPPPEAENPEVKQK